MSDRETINGVPVTEEQIAAWAAEAEAGYDVDVLKKRGRGRPGRGAEPSQVVALRLTSEELAELDALAATRAQDAVRVDPRRARRVRRVNIHDPEAGAELTRHGRDAPG